MSFQVTNAYINEIIENDMGELIPMHSIDNLGPQIGFAEFERLVEQAHRAFSSKPAKGFGFFDADSNFKKMIDLMLDGADFNEFAFLENTHLISELSKYPFADTGLVVFARYWHFANDLLLVTIIPFTEGMKISFGRNLSRLTFLDISGITIAAVVNITEYQTNPDSKRYVSYIKGRAGRRVGDFFFDFLGIQNGIDIKMQNTILMQAVNDFINDQTTEQDEALLIRKQVKAHCFDVAKLGEEVDIAELSGEMPTNNGQSFEHYVIENGYELAPQFPVDKKMISKLVAYKGAGGGINIQFDRALLSERVFYDVETDTLTIKGTPPNLRDQLVRNQ
ncbi:TPA: nucleoid-associated protein YejK [Vibrio vulnificus]|nr:nucleoid-associated protein YejK [Vibrio vulnificus]